MNNHFDLLDWIVLVAYFLGTMSIGFYFWRKSRSTESFTAAGRALPGWIWAWSAVAPRIRRQSLELSWASLPFLGCHCRN